MYQLLLSLLKLTRLTKFYQTLKKEIYMINMVWKELKMVEHQVWEVLGTSLTCSLVEEEQVAQNNDKKLNPF